MRPRRSWPRLEVALIADRGAIRSHLVGRGMPGSVCGLSASGAVMVPEPSTLADHGRITCPRCRVMAPYLPTGWAA